MIGFDEATSIVRAVATPLGGEVVPLRRAHGRVLAGPVTARVDCAHATVCRPMRSRPLGCQPLLRPGNTRPLPVKRANPNSCKCRLPALRVDERGMAGEQADMGIVLKQAKPYGPDGVALAHDLANLVQAVSGNLELLASRTTDEAGRRYIANARAAAEQLEQLTRKLRGDNG